jgi:hypothetical protein
MKYQSGVTTLLPLAKPQVLNVPYVETRKELWGQLKASKSVVDESARYG